MTNSKARRINARLPPDVARKVSYLERRRNKSTTQIVLESIEHYYLSMLEGEGLAAERLAQAGFVGCATGPRNLSTTYEAQLTASLAPKT